MTPRSRPGLAWLCLVLPLAASGAGAPSSIAQGFRALFDGHSLSGWETPDPSYWSVEDGAITARITPDHPCATNQYLVWEGGDLADFELVLQSRVSGQGGINNGFQFRSRLLPDHDVCGYQVDNNLETPWLVRLYDEFGRHTLAWRGERAAYDATGRRTVSKFPDADRPAWFRLDHWHEYRLLAVGSQITLDVDGQRVAEVDDSDPRRADLQGILALQLHSGPPTLAQFKDIRLRILPPARPPVSHDPDHHDPIRATLRRNARAWWSLDTGGHGATPPLRHIPGWDQFELNVRALGPGARPDARVVLLHGAYFDAGPDLHAGTDQATLYLRARDPSGAWNGGLLAKRGGHDRVHVNLFSVDLPETAGPDIGFELRTDRGFAQISFPVSDIAADAWHDLVARYDGRSLELFCDGRRRAGKSWTGRLLENREPLLIGAETDGTNVVRHFHGELEEAALWPRALSDAEIAGLSARNGPPPVH